MIGGDGAGFSCSFQAEKGICGFQELHEAVVRLHLGTQAFQSRQRRLEIVSPVDHQVQEHYRGGPRNAGVAVDKDPPAVLDRVLDE